MPQKNPQLASRISSYARKPAGKMHTGQSRLLTAAYMPSTAPVELDCKIAVLMETPNVVSAEDGYYPRHSVEHAVEQAAFAPFLIDKNEQRALWIEVLLQCPNRPGISWMY